MGKRGPGSFKKLDAQRAIERARAAGIEPAMVEIVSKDGVTIRVYGDKATPPATTSEVMTARNGTTKIAKRRRRRDDRDQLHLRFVHAFVSDGGGVYHYFRQRGSPRTPLPGLAGPTAFMGAYQGALGAAPVAIGDDLRSRPGISSAVAEYYGSRAFRGLTGGTPQKRRALLERFREQYGHKPLASLPKEFIAALLDPMPPHAARNWLKAVLHFIRSAEDRKLI